MAVITGEGYYTSDFRVASTGVFPDIGAGQRVQLGMQCLFSRSGTAADQVDRYHALRYTFVASTAQEIDVLSLVGPRVRLWQIAFEDGTNTAAWLKLGGAALNAWAAIGDLTIYPGSATNHGGLILPAPAGGIPVTSGSKMLKMLPSAHAFSIRILALGASV
jgi:hypothetical protein